MVTITRSEPLTPEQIAGMNRAQLMSEIKTHYERAAEIERKYPDGPITDREEEAEVKQILRAIDKMEDALAPLEEANERKSRIYGNVEKYNAAAGSGHRHVNPDEERAQAAKSPGFDFTGSAEYKALVQSGILRNNSNRVELAVPVNGSLLEKALLYGSGSSVGGALVNNDIQPGVSVPQLFREMTVLDLISRTTTTSDTIEYVQESAATNAAAPTAEATATTGTSGTKPEGAISYTTQTSPVRTIAWWIPITNRMLADAPALRGIIDQRLLLGLNLTLESQVITGDGTGENLTGINSATGLNVTAVGTGNDLDAIFRGMTQVRVTGLSRPTGSVLHPIDFQTIRLARESASTATPGGYLMGPPSQVGATTLWGLPIVQSLGVPQGTAFTGDFQMGCMLFDREEAQVRVGLINDQFTRNMQTILAELRAAFVVWRGAAFSKITGL
jgi:HK97 family phage major capsid protein